MSNERDELAAARRADCRNWLHNHPLPSGYNSAHEEARERLSHHWKQAVCPECGALGWIQP